MLAVLAACSQKDQRVPLEPESNAPVTSVIGSGSTTISTPSGLSMTVPDGALPTGTEIAVVKLDQSETQSVPGSVGDAYLVGFDGVTTMDPSIAFSFTPSENTTAGQLVGMVPLVLRVGSPGTTATALTASRLAAPSSVRADVSSTSAEEKLQLMLAAGIFDGMAGSATITGGLDDPSLAAILQLVGSPPPSPPIFADLPSDSWDSGYLDAMNAAGLTGFLDSNPESPIFGQLPAIMDLPSGDAGINELFGSYISDGGSAYLITQVTPTTLRTYGLAELPPNDPESHPLIPVGDLSATFTLACTGIQWPGADGVPSCSEDDIDVRAGAELLSRYPATVVVPNYLLASVTLGGDGLATGQVEYETYLRSALASGITGVGREGSFELDGTWSVSGDTITIGDHRFAYTVPDAQSLILSISDSVQVENNDGTESWQPIQANVKMVRQ